MASKSTKFYRENPEALEKKRKYNQLYKKGLKGGEGLEAQERVKDATKQNRKNGTYGNGDGKDYDHADGKLKKAVKNRNKPKDKWKTKRKKRKALKKALKK